jgi:hypothetical protein
MLSNKDVEQALDRQMGIQAKKRKSSKAIRPYPQGWGTLFKQPFRKNSKPQANANQGENDLRPSVFIYE